jgi:pyruvate kinase
MANKFSLTKIVATLGPSSEDEAVLRAMIEAGMSVARINCSHGDWDVRRQRIELIRRLSKEYNRPIGIMADLQGPKIRTGTLPEAGVPIKAGEKIILTVNESSADYTSSPLRVFIRNYPELPTEVAPGQRVLLDDGLLRLQVLSINGSDVACEVAVGGVLKSNKGVNLPESEQLNLVAITQKDREDIKHAVALQVDFIALSFVRHGDDIKELKALIWDAHPEAPIKIIAKIEKPQAIKQLDSILDEVDGIMVARGDLGVELDPEKVPMLPKEIIRRSNYHEKFVITATQMMDSMIKNPFPTRAEVSDVANAILDGTDAVMLSGETASGDHPVLAVDYMRKVALEAEASGCIEVKMRDLATIDPTDEEKINSVAIAQSIKNYARLDHIKAIVAFSCSGRSVQLISKMRPKSSIIACTTYRQTYNYLSIVWGVTPIYFNQVDRTTQTMINIENELINKGIVNQGETIVITGGIPIAARSVPNFIKIQKCDGSLSQLLRAQQTKDSQYLDKKDLGPTLAAK